MIQVRAWFQASLRLLCVLSVSNRLSAREPHGSNQQRLKRLSADSFCFHPSPLPSLFNR